MQNVMQLAGFVGAALAGAAYVPQIWHLLAERCSAGISRLAFATWLAASALVTAHAVAIASPVFVVLGAVQVLATALIVVFSTRYRDSRCPTHRTIVKLSSPAQTTSSHSSA